jgi:hypothetical protein
MVSPARRAWPTHSRAAGLDLAPGGDEDLAVAGARGTSPTRRDSRATHYGRTLKSATSHSLCWTSQDRETSRLSRRHLPDQPGNPCADQAPEFLT